MTSVCYVCAKALGEKCPTCGQPAAVKMVFKGVAYLCLNLDCPVGWFVAGTGGTSHGLCMACEKIEREKLQRYQNNLQQHHKFTRFARGTQ